MFNRANTSKGTGMVEKLRNRISSGDQARPIQVAEDRADLGKRPYLLNKAELLGGSIPVGAIIDQAIDPPPQFLVQRLAEIFLPPEVERKVGVQVRKNDIRQCAHHAAIELEGDLLGTVDARPFPRGGSGADPRAGLLARGSRVGEDEESAAGVLAGDLGDQIGIFRNESTLLYKSRD